MTVHPQVGPPWDLTDDEASRFLAATQTARETFLPGWRLRPGGHCEAKGGLTTLWAYDPAEEPDSHGRRPSDINAGTVLTPDLARALCAAYNDRTDQVARLRPVFEAIDAATQPYPCPSDPCPLCTAMENFQSLLLRLESGS